MTRDELLAKLKEAYDEQDEERGHLTADTALLEYINDKTVTAAYAMIDKWYA